MSNGESLQQLIQEMQTRARGGESEGARASRVAQERRDRRFGRVERPQIRSGGGGGPGTAGLTAFQPGFRGLLQALAETGGLGTLGAAVPATGFASAIRGREVARRPENRAQELQLQLLEEQLKAAQRAGRSGPSVSTRGGGGQRFSIGSAPTGGPLTLGPSLGGPSSGRSIAPPRSGLPSPRRRPSRRLSFEQKLLREQLKLQRERQEEEIAQIRREERDRVLNERLKRQNQGIIRDLLTRFLG